ncbi:hypothetical protein GCM10023310_54840 [Paenibacillus vulneris]|uniref:Uncharacterized protein n=1 Tax=Paenibacillus vulneris TaxID=1133364 RepID=A0ABW3UYA7_9BACL
MHHVMIAAQTVLYGKRQEIGLSHNQVVQLSKEITRLTRLLENVSQQTENGMREIRGRVATRLLSKEQLLECIATAWNMGLEEEFVAFLFKKLLWMESYTKLSEME